MIKRTLHSEIFIWVIFLLAAYFLVFLHIDHHPLYVWDEGLFANRAYHWAQFGTYFTNWLEVDNCDLNHANTKPPLMSLVQAGFFKIFGYNILSLRVPIAITGLLTAIFVVRFAKKNLMSSHLGVLAALILLTTIGYNAIHVLKSGDHDTAVTFFLTLSWMNLFYYLHGDKRKNLALIGFFAFTGFAVLTKSIAGFMMMPGALIYILVSKRGRAFFTNKWTYVGGGVLLLLIASFYLTTEWYRPGFLKLVWDNEVNRYGKVIDNHSQSWYFYVLLLKEKLGVWTMFVFFGVLGGMTSQHQKVRWLTVFVSIQAVAFLTMLSLASTKLDWYVAPVYPLLAMLAAFGVKYLFIDLVGGHLSQAAPKWKWLGLVIVLSTCGFQVTSMIKDRYKPKDYWKVMEYERSLWKLKKEHPDIKKLRIHTRKEWYPNLIYLANLFNDHYGYEIDILNSGGEIHPEDVLLGQDHSRFTLYRTEKLLDMGEIKLIKVFGRKEQTD